jgi:hypothetical protein
MISDMRPQVSLGADVENLVALATDNAGRLVGKLLIDSISLWATAGFNRYNDHEVSFTIRLFACMEAVKASNRGEMALMHLQYDAPLPTREMLSGLADAMKTPRPDLTVKCGDASIHLEAKILMPARGYPAKYVNDGMLRFIDGRYVPAGVSLALMLGYILKGSPSDCYAAVNNVILSDTRFEATEVTKQLEVLLSVTIYGSDHKFGEIIHYAIDMRTRMPPAQQ